MCGVNIKAAILKYLPMYFLIIWTINVVILYQAGRYPTPLKKKLLIIKYIHNLYYIAALEHLKDDIRTKAEIKYDRDNSRRYRSRVATGHGNLWHIHISMYIGRLSIRIRWQILNEGDQKEL